MKIGQLCAEHFAEYVGYYGDDGGAVLSMGTCHDCERHQIGCICADCSGAELTEDND